MQAELHWQDALSLFSSIGDRECVIYVAANVAPNVAANVAANVAGDGENEAVLRINLAQLMRGRSARLYGEAGTLTVTARTHLAEAVRMYENEITCNDM